MEAQFEVRGEVLVVELRGRVDFETGEPFRKTCLSRLLTQKVIFDLKSLNFVGSLGLTEFVDTMDHLAKRSAPGIKFCGVSSEFRRLFEASGISSLEIYENREKALLSFLNPQAPSII